jgi:hypothetical protein
MSVARLPVLMRIVHSGSHGRPESRAAQCGLGNRDHRGLRELIMIAAEQGRDIRGVRPVAVQSMKPLLSKTLLPR